MDLLDLGYGSTALLGLIAAPIVAVLLQLFVWMGLWRTLQRMGRHDFAALVPGYGTWELCRGAGFSPGLATVTVLLRIGLAVCGILIFTLADPGRLQQQAMAAVGGTGPSSLEALGLGASQYVQGLYQDHGALLVASGVICGLCLILSLYALYGAARSFGHGFGFALGLLLLPFIFFMVLGFSSRRPYEGPYLSKDIPVVPAGQWASLVASRKDTFGSNAPLALALAGMMMGAALLTAPSIVLCIVALVKNAGEKGKPLAGAKCTVTTVVAVLGIVMAVAMVAAMILLGGLANTFYGVLPL